MSVCQTTAWFQVHVSHRPWQKLYVNDFGTFPRSSNINYRFLECCVTWRHWTVTMPSASESIGIFSPMTYTAK
ncbi:hypothetical protein PR048_027670 [Dryococelus australis]|uniref:Uncharacterized protein n=1 Tax=Dryococelus australis TaxID=614101 RepID=A0ABQ9GH60_9NEOP|nr:hypothetical protein PR048_027670 [Dryococelus australis]